MRRIALDDTPFRGKVSRPAAPLDRARAVCPGCGSSLAGRADGVRTIGGRLMRVFACPCGRRRRVEVRASH